MENLPGVAFPDSPCKLFWPLPASCQHDRHQSPWLSMETTQGPQPRGDTRICSTRFSTQQGNYEGGICPIKVHTAPATPFTSCRTPHDFAFQKALPSPTRSLSPAPGLGFGSSQALSISVYVCLAARGQNKGRAKVPLQPQHGAEEIHF